MIDGKNFFDQPINSELKTYENIRKIATAKGDDYTTGCVKNYKMIAIDLSKQQAMLCWSTSNSTNHFYSKFR